MASARHQCVIASTRNIIVNYGPDFLARKTCGVRPFSPDPGAARVCATFPSVWTYIHMGGIMQLKRPGPLIKAGHKHVDGEAVGVNGVRF
jgi:hypothetical protein